MLGFVLRSGYTPESAQSYIGITVTTTKYCLCITRHTLDKYSYPMKVLDHSHPLYMGIDWNPDLAMVGLPSPTLGPWGYVFSEILGILGIF